MKNKILIIIPTFNEEASLERTVSEIIATKLKVDIAIINDGSTDKTKEVAGKLTKKQNITLINLPFNLGIGGAVQTGLKHARLKGYHLAVQVDADGQHDPKYLKTLLGSIAKCDMVIGSRYIKKTGYKTPPARFIGIKSFSTLIYLSCGKKVYDTTSGYRVFGPKAIEYFSHYYPQEFPEPRSIVSFLKNGYKIKEIPVESRQRSGGKSSISLLYAIYLMCSISISILFETFKTNKYE